MKMITKMKNRSHRNEHKYELFHRDYAYMY